MENMYFVFLMGVVVGVVATCIVGLFGTLKESNK